MMSARRLHGFLGLVLSAAMIFLAVTGSLSVFADEIEWLATPAMRVDREAAGKLPLGRSLEAGLAAVPGARPVVLTRHPGGRFADRLHVVGPGRTAAFVWVDPYSGEVTGTGPAVSLRQVLREMHRSLSTGRDGVILGVTALSLPLAATAIAGVLLYRRFWTGFFRLPRLSGSRRAMLSDLHRLLAVWLLPFLAVTIVTGLVFLSELAGLGPSMPSMPWMPMADIGGGSVRAGAIDGPGLDAAVAQATAALPGLVVTEVGFPMADGDPLAIRGSDGTALVRPTAGVGFVDPVTLTLIGAIPAAELGERMRLFEAVRVLHYGTALGLPTRLLWLAFGLGLAALGVLGAMISAERLKREFAVRGRPPRSGTRHYFSGPGAANWIGLGAAVVALGLAAATL